MVSDLPRAAQSWQSSLEAGTHSAFPVRHTLPFSLESSRAGDEDWQSDGRVVGLPPTPPASQRRLALTAASSGDHPSSGATSTSPARSLSSLFPLIKPLGIVFKFFKSGVGEKLEFRGAEEIR